MATARVQGPPNTIKKDRVKRTEAQPITPLFTLEHVEEVCVW